MSRHVCATGTRLIGARARLRRGASREIRSADTRNVSAVDPDRERRSASRWSTSSASKSAEPRRRRRRAPRTATAPSGNVPNAATSPSEFADASWSGSFTMFGTRRVLRRPPQQREHLDQERDDDETEQVRPRTAAARAAPARPMSHVTITTLRFQRSTSAPPSGASTKPGQHARDHHEADRGRRVRHAARDREDREQPDPVAEARHDLRAEERQEARARGTPATAPAGSARWSGAGGMNGAWSLTRRSA